MPKRRTDLDYARGIAILLILVGHTNGISDNAIKVIYSFHVPLFFVISGMLLRYTGTVERPWRRICQNWWKRYICIVIVWEIILSVFYYLIKDIAWQELLINSVTLNFNLATLWFIPCLIVAEAICIALLKKVKYVTKPQGCAICVILFAVAAEMMPYLFFRRAFVAVVFIFAGYALEQLRSEVREKKQMAAVAVAATIIWLLAMSENVRADLSAGVLGNRIQYYLHSICGSIAILAVCNIAGDGISLLCWIGQRSMGFLVTHIFVRYAVITAEKVIFGQFFGGWVLAIPIIVLDCAAVWLIGKILPEIIGGRRKKGVLKQDA